MYLYLCPRSLTKIHSAENIWKLISFSWQQMIFFPLFTNIFSLITIVKHSLVKFFSLSLTINVSFNLSTNLSHFPVLLLTNLSFFPDHKQKFSKVDKTLLLWQGFLIFLTTKWVFSWWKICLTFLKTDVSFLMMTNLSLFSKVYSCWQIFSFPDNKVSFSW